MGLDLLDVGFRIERHFGVKISHEQWAKMAVMNEPPDIKVWQLFELICAQGPHSGVFDLSADVDIFWPLLQWQLSDALGVELSDVTKDKGLIYDLGAT